MKEKMKHFKRALYVIFSTFILFIVVADIFKLVFRRVEWLVDTGIFVLFYIIGDIYSSYLDTSSDDKENRKIIDISTRKKSRSQSIVSLIIEIGILSFVPGCVVAFIEGVVLSLPWFAHTIIAVIAFFIGSIFGGILPKKK